MATKLAECASCHKKIVADSAFCSHCGRPVPPPPSDRQAMLARTGDIFPPDDVSGLLGNINNYLSRWPDGPEARDARFARQCIGLLIQLDILPELLKYEDQAELASAVGEGVPLILSNGLATAGCLPHPDKARQFLSWMENALKKCAVLLDALHKSAHDEAQSLLVDGEPKASVQRLTNEYFLKEAEVHYAAYSAGKLDAAYSGFALLKQLNPHDSYLRNMLGSVLLKQDKQMAALQQFLYGFSLNPTDIHLTGNTMRCLSGMTMYPAVIEIGRLYTQLGGDPGEPTIRPWVALARACSAASCAKAVQCEPGDFSAEAPDLIDDVVYPDHPWMPAYLFSVDAVLGKARMFISYRRTGGGNHARRLQEALAKRLPSMRIFRDETSMMAGQDFTVQLQQEIDKADVFLALIDADWTGSKQTGKSRLLDPKDVLRREIERALKSKTIVIPLLIDQARMPAEREFPKTLVPFSLFHALTLSEARFDEDLEHVLGEMVKPLGNKALGERAGARARQRRKALEKLDPEAARKLDDDELESNFETYFDGLPRFFKEKSSGKGVPLGRVEWSGVWECTATAPAWQIALRFEAERLPHSPFTGELVVTRGAPETREEIRGTWMVVLDTESKLLLGMVLDGTKSGLAFKVRIPFDRWVGSDLIGTDAQGVTYLSRNLGPSWLKAF
jgi:hypothetical protein